MRTRKKRGKLSSAVHLNEDDILQAIKVSLENQGFDLGNKCWFILNCGSKTKRKKPMVQIGWELKDEPKPNN